MRLFIALDLPANLHDWVKNRQAELERHFPMTGLRWSPGRQWHITLRFLGHCPDYKINAAWAAMKCTAEETPSFSLGLGKAGSFSGPRMGALWLGVASGSELLAPLVTRLNKHLDEQGFPKEERPFRGHVTLARSREKLPSVILKNLPAPTPCPEAPIHHLNLYESTLSPEGSHYTLLHSARLRLSSRP